LSYDRILNCCSIFFVNQKGTKGFKGPPKNLFFRGNEAMPKRRHFCEAKRVEGHNAELGSVDQRSLDEEESCRNCMASSCKGLTKSHRQRRFPVEL